jgi:soluble lytic murein transglycosylase
MRRALRWPAIATLAILACSLYLTAAPDPLPALKSALAARDAKRYAAAISSLEALAPHLPQLADYVAWFLGSSQFDAQDYAAAPRTLETVFAHRPVSPLIARAALLSSEALLKSRSAPAAVAILRRHYQVLPQPAGDFALASALAAAGEAAGAALYYQRVYYGHPLSTEAALADTALSRLRASLATDYPPPMPPAMLERAAKLLEGGKHDVARKELELLVPLLGGSERELARVRIGAAQYLGNQTPSARKHLASLQVSWPEADAERLYYLALIARRLNDPAEVHNLLDQLERRHFGSEWRVRALVAAANGFLLENRADAYEPLYRACFEALPRQAEAALCHWKVAWAHYIRRKPDSADLLRAQVRLFPASTEASAALYFLGRLAEDARDPGAARAYYERAVRDYSNLYYGILARDRLAEVRAAAPSAAAIQFLRTVPDPARASARDFQPSPATRLRLERARMLASAGLESWAEGELRFAAENGGGGEAVQPHLIAMELAGLVGAGNPGQALRYIKRYVATYNYMPVESAPLDFWRLAFPLPYRSEMDRYARQYDIDFFLMAALIRQESEFDARAVSRAGARGLTQIKPSTGRELSARLRVPGYTTAALFQPALNVRLGAYYFRTVSDQLGGRLEPTLAAYNAGLSRARVWLSWADYREPAEFIETIPLTETRGYIQAVLRNADMYRRVYGAPQR